MSGKKVETNHFKVARSEEYDVFIKHSLRVREVKIPKKRP